MTDLEIALGYVGFAVAAIGTCAAVPAATWRLVERVRSAIDRLLHGPAPVSVERHFGDAVLGSDVTVTARGFATGGTVEERLARVEQRLLMIEDKQDEAAANLRREIADRTRADTELREHTIAELARIDRAAKDQQRDAERVDAKALPILVGGAFLSTFPNLLGADVYVGNLTLCVGMGAFFYAWVLIDSARPDPSG